MQKLSDCLTQDSITNASHQELLVYDQKNEPPNPGKWMLKKQSVLKAVCIAWGIMEKDFATM